MNQHANDALQNTPPEWLVVVVERIVLESGDRAGFAAEAWAAEWLATENAALGCRKPNDLLGTPEGRDLVKALVLRMQSGAYS